MRSLARLRTRIGQRPRVLPAMLIVLFVATVVILTMLATSPAWVLLVRGQLSAVLRWTGEHWLDANAIIGTAIGFASIVVSIVLYRRGQLRISEQERQTRQRKVMLQKVRHKWLSAEAEPSLAKAAHLALGLQYRRDVLDLGSRAHRLPDGSPAQIPTGTPISKLFEQTGSELLILGNPGAGKTTLLLELADDLLKHAQDQLNRAEQDPKAPLPILPVVFNLASWARARQPLTSWLVDELKDGYGVHERTAQAWIDERALILLLDGLDEVAEPHRAACVEAINAYRREHGLVPLAVCSRTQEATDLHAHAATLRLDAAVELQPPTDAQIAHYLDHLEATGTPLADVRAALADDQELQALLQSPLMLHVIAVAYHGRPAPALLAPGTPEQRRTLLWEAYVRQMLKQRPVVPHLGYTPQQALGWLTWLARALRGRSATEFYLDRLTPDWLRVASGLTWSELDWWKTKHSLVIGLAVSLVFGLAVELVHILVFGLAVGQGAGWILGPVYGTIYGLTTRPAEELHWSWPKMLVVLGSGLVLGLAYGLILWLADGLVFWLLGQEGVLQQNVGLLAGLGNGALVGLGFSLPVALYIGVTPELRDARATPNEGIHRSARHGLLGGLLGGLLYGPFMGILIGPFGGLAFGLLAGLLVGLPYGGAAVLQHYVVRTFLVKAQLAPWRYSVFLEAMAERLLLRRSGSAYLFTHRLLRDYLAELGPSACQQLLTEDKQ